MSPSIDPDVMRLVRVGRRQAGTGPTGREMFNDLLVRLRELAGDDEVDAALSAAGPRSWSLEECQRSALRYETRGAWEKGDRKAYTAAHKHGWLDECCGHMESCLWTLEKCKASALRYETRGAWKTGDYNAYQSARHNNWREHCCAHMVAAQQSWSLEKCKASALRYETRWAWRRGDPKAYDAACRYKWLKQCCAHMGPPTLFGKRKPRATPGAAA